MVKVFGDLPFMWETHMEFLVHFAIKASWEVKQLYLLHLIIFQPLGLSNK